jgi:hypothetical protein
VSSLSTFANGLATTNSVSGTNITADTALIASTISSAVSGKAAPPPIVSAAATAIANVYAAAKPTSKTANAILSAIASGLNTGISNAAAAGPRGAAGLLGSNSKASREIATAWRGRLKILPADIDYAPTLPERFPSFRNDFPRSPAGFPLPQLHEIDGLRPGPILAFRK